MANLPMTAFHIDFSTLDIENGRKALAPFVFNYTIQPILRIEGLPLEEKQKEQQEERVPAKKARKRASAGS